MPPAVQHAAPAPPQPPQAPLPQVPSPPPQAAPLSMQRLFTQHAPTPAHVVLSQHGCPALPHATRAPALHTVPAAGLSPLGMHWPVAALKHPPPAHVLFAHGGW